MKFEKLNGAEIVKENLVEKKLKKFFSEIFEDDSEPDKRLDNIQNRLKLFLEPGDNNQISQEEVFEIVNNIKDICSVDNESEFVARGLVSLKPLFDWQARDPRSFEAKLRENQIAFLKYDVLNEALTYNQHGDDIHLHVSPSETLSLSEKLALIKDGFSRLAKVLVDNENIKNIVATSWIVAANPGIMEKLGFTIDGEISPEERANWRSVDDKSISRAHISSEDFLKIYR